jgi:PhzF family phenazine biosynthesis protein
MSLERSYKQVDVFTSVKFKGNPVAVFFSAESLSSEDMQTIANWTNLSETTFVLPSTRPEADYRLRIFTPGMELPFAGHPTIGSCHAVLESGFAKSTNGKVVQECEAGLVELQVGDDNSIQFKLPKYEHKIQTSETLLNEIAEAVRWKRSDIKNVVCVDDGPIWLTIQFSSGEVVFDLVPDYEKIDRVCQNNGFQGFSCFGPYQDGTYEARNFFVENTGIEDPVCGSGAAADGSLLAEISGFEGEFIIRQGRKLGRDGKVKVTCKKKKNGENDYSIYVGGNAVTCFEGKW